MSNRPSNYRLPPQMRIGRSTLWAWQELNSPRRTILHREYGDGVGDFAGLIASLDYLAALSVTCLWLLPYHPTPYRDSDYDSSDYYAVDPRLGTLGDFVTFLDEAKARGLRVLADLVVNHTSAQHPWFLAARHDRLSSYRAYWLHLRDRAR